MGERYQLSIGVAAKGVERSFDLWEYDTTRDRMPESGDLRMRHPVVRLVDSYRSRREAELALAALNDKSGPQPEG